MAASAGLEYGGTQRLYNSYFSVGFISIRAPCLDCSLLLTSQILNVLTLSCKIVDHSWPIQYIRMIPSWNALLNYKKTLFTLESRAITEHSNWISGFSLNVHSLNKFVEIEYSIKQAWSRKIMLMHCCRKQKIIYLIQTYSKCWIFIKESESSYRKRNYASVAVALMITFVKALAIDFSR